MAEAVREEGEIWSDDEPEVVPTRPERQSVRPVNQIPCRYCRRKFTKPGNLSKHIRRIHMELWGGHPPTTEVKETKNYIQCIRAGMWQFSQSYGNLDGKTAFEQLNQAVVKLGEGRQMVSRPGFVEAELEYVKVAIVV